MGNSTKTSKTKLLSNHLERAFFDASEQDAHILLAGSQILLVVIRVVLQHCCPLSHLAIQDPDSEAESRGSDQRWLVD